ncbi:mediator of RNA polymerase II transcription subunit 15a-like isoform X2 [Rhodamnia argentea]|uniref:Mediator of RNA polymerase II transcription subunit 15a-like isoform X2 n=1 Tax=Rhodamnia argentea TaxID=178133 RepID=A0ABM3HFX3_9MYRT|nr:mediator of RNA polymerase II transcription subunit 15a-like isoform X2 [Rhodamnia argentea]
MESNNNPVAKAQGGAPAVEGGEWRQSWPPESRKRVVNNFMENLIKCVPLRGQEGLPEAQKVAMQLEDRLYTAASSQQDYVRRVSLKMLQIERCQQNKGANSLLANTSGTSNMPSDPGAWTQIQNQSQSNPNQAAVNQSQAQHRTQCPPNLSSMPPPGNSNWNSTPSAGGLNSNMQHIRVFSDKPQMGMKGRDISSSMFCNPQRQIRGPEQHQSQNPQQHLYNQQLQRQAMKQNFHNLSPATRSQPPQQSVLQTCPITQQIVMQSSPLSSLHQSQLSYTQQSKQSVLQQHQESVARLQHQTQHTSAYPVPPQQQNIGQQATVLNMPQNNFINQHSSLMNMQQQLQNDIPNQQQVQQQFVRTQYGCSSKQGCMQEPPNYLPSGSYHSGMQRNLQASRSSMQHQSMTNQQMQSFPSQVPLPGTSNMKSFAFNFAESLDSISQTDTACAGNWQEESFQKINDMKRLYLSELEEIYSRVSMILQQNGSIPQSPNSGQYQRYKKMVAQVISFLRVPKSKISPSMKDNLSSYEESIVNIINVSRTGRLIPLQQPQVPPPSPHMQSMPPEQSPAQFPPVLSPGIDMSETTVNFQCNPNMLQFNYLNQHQERRMLQNQQLKQQFQECQVQPQLMQKQQISQQLPACLQTYQMSQPHQMGDPNDSKMRSVGPGSISQQHRLSGYRSTHLDQQLKSGTSLPKSSQQLLPAASIQISEHPSPDIDRQKLLMASTKTGTFLQYADSPFIVPSPATPLGFSPMPAETKKSISGLSSLSNGGNIGQLQTDDAPASTPPVSIGTPGISVSPLLAELSSPDGAPWKSAKTSSGKSSVTEEPVERLIRAVNSVSHEAFQSAVSDIMSVARGGDCLAGTGQGSGSRNAVGEDLAATLKCHLQSQISNLQDEISGTRKLKRHVWAMPLNLVSSPGSMNDSFAQRTGSEISDIESTASSSIKRPRYEANYDLCGEIKQINQQLILTVVDISDEEVDSHAASSFTKVGEGTIVKCSFTGVGISPIQRSQTTSLKTSLIQPLWLLLPMNYPNCSPILLDKLPVDVSKEAEDLSAKAKSRLGRALRMLAQPMSLRGIALSWEESVRAVILDFARQSGGGSFSSKYGAWEQCS